VPGSAQEWRIHTVSRGEHLTGIAAKYNVTLRELREWNDLGSDKLLVGQKLRIPAEDQEWYVVRRGDNLSEIAQRHDISVEFLRQLNGLRSDGLAVGQKLKLRPSPRDEAVHVVRSGDHLTRIARMHGLTVADLKRINDLRSDRIFVGQQLRLRETDRTVHVVERGDALWEIAKAYGMSVERLKTLNGLTSNRIHPGMELQLKDNGSPKLAVYTVKRGDNLTEIARLHQMSLPELRRLNGLRGSVIQPGQKLQVRPLLGYGRKPEELDWARLAVSVPNVQRIVTANGPYYWAAPRADAQKSKTYVEESQVSPKVAYQHGRKLWERFEATIAGITPLSNDLAGWHIVLDPGHGGIDPGTIVRAKDAEGKAYYLVEDEYVYDLALRAAALLKLHGADVSLTMLSPNHLLRGNMPVTQTFVHDRNEVFNDEVWNRSSKPRTWPKGGQTYLDERIKVARRVLTGVPADRQVFLSFHADNDPTAGDAVTLFYYQDRRRTDTKSRDFASSLLSAMGAGARIKGKSLGVLRNNPVRYKLLVEMRNLAYQEHIWALRYEELRQRDAEKVVQALREALGDGGELAARKR